MSANKKARMKEKKVLKRESMLIVRIKGILIKWKLKYNFQGHNDEAWLDIDQIPP